MADVVERPVLTLPEAEADALRAAYGAAGCVLEYGSGGSTVLAVEAGARVWSVESDAGWADGMRRWFAANPGPGTAEIIHADIGPTRDWGHPVDDGAFRAWPDYPLRVWDLPGFTHPDVVLVDGRFRLACFLTVAYRITRPVRLYFDDYAGRAAYHKAARHCPPTRIIGRMAEFDLTPAPLSPDRLRAYAKALLQPL